MRQVNDKRAEEKLIETEEYRRGDKSKRCTGCLKPKNLNEFSTRLSPAGRRLVAWCKECVKIKPTLPKVEGRQFVNYYGGYTRRARQGLR